MKNAIAVMLGIVIFAESNLVFGIAMSNEPKDNDVKGYFAASILLSEVQWDPDKFLKDLLSDWDIDFSSDDNDKDAIVACAKGYLAEQIRFCRSGAYARTRAR